jgi:hypothetical protein
VTTPAVREIRRQHEAGEYGTDEQRRHSEEEYDNPDEYEVERLIEHVRDLLEALDSREQQLYLAHQVIAQQGPLKRKCNCGFCQEYKKDHPDA